MTNAIAKLVCFAIVIASVSISKADQSLANKVK